MPVAMAARWQEAYDAFRHSEARQTNEDNVKSASQSDINRWCRGDHTKTRFVVMIVMARDTIDSEDWYPMCFGGLKAGGHVGDQLQDMLMRNYGFQIPVRIIYEFYVSVYHCTSFFSLPPIMRAGILRMLRRCVGLSPVCGLEPYGRLLHSSKSGLVHIEIGMHRFHRG